MQTTSRYVEKLLVVQAELLLVSSLLQQPLIWEVLVRKNCNRK